MRSIDDEKGVLIRLSTVVHILCRFWFWILYHVSNIVVQLEVYTIYRHATRHL